MVDKKPTMEPERPVFARDFPRVPALDALVDAFAAGDYARVRAGAATLIRSAEPEEVQRAARSLVARTNPDPLAVWLVALSGVLILVISAYWIAQGKGPRTVGGQRPTVEHVR